MKRFVFLPYFFAPLLALSAAESQVETIAIDEVPVDIFRPVDQCHKTILVLPGYNHSRKRMQKETKLLAHARRQNFCLVMPEMGRAIYASEYFKETKRRAFSIPSGRWMLEVFLPKLQQDHQLFLPWHKNFMLGISTGGRGAVLTALRSAGFFRGVAAIAGDYDQSKMPKDKLMTAVYGPYDQFSNRWLRYDNPTVRIARFKLPLYLAHGKKDKVVPFSQSEAFYQKLKKVKPDLKVVFSPGKGGHTYKYFGQEAKKALDFFTGLP